jgi:hypothetical protein
MTAGKEKIMDKAQQLMFPRLTQTMKAIIAQAGEEPGSELNWQVWQARVGSRRIPYRQAD